MKVVTTALAVLVLILSAIASVQAIGAVPYSLYPIPSAVGISRAFIIDYDGDNSPDVLTDNAIVSENVRLSISFSEFFRADIDLDGITEVVGISNGSLYAFTPGKIVALNMSVDEHYPVRVWSYGFAVGRTYYVNGTVMEAGDNAVPIIYGGTPSVIEARENGLYLVNSSGASELFPISGGHVIAGRAYGNIIEVLVSGDGNVFMFRYDTLSGTIFIRDITAPDVEWGTWLPERGAYLLASSDTAFLFFAENETLKVVGAFTELIYPADDTSSFILIQGNTAVLYTSGNRVVLQAPYPIKWADYFGGTWLIVSEDGTVYSDKIRWSVPTWFEVWFNTQTAIYTSEELAVEVGGNFSVGTLAIGSSTYTVRPGDVVSVAVAEPGTIPISLTACDGTNCVVRNASVVVLPRPLSVSVFAPPSAEPYNTIVLGVRATDALTNSSVSATCSVKLGNQTLTVTTPANVSVFVVPSPDDANEITGSVTCGASGYSDAVTYFRIPLNDTYVEVRVSYAGNGRVFVEAINKYTGELLDADITVSVDGTQAGKYRGRGLVVLQPGNHTVTVEVSKGEITLYRKTYAITYYPSVFTVPTTVPVYVADRVSTTTVTMTETQTYTKTDIVMRTVKKVDIPLAIGLLSGGIAGGVALGFFIRGRGGKTKKQATASAPRPQYVIYPKESE